MRNTASFKPSFTVDIFESRTPASAAAATNAATAIRANLAAKGRARIMVGTGNSQLEMIDFLVDEPGIDWSQVEVFHLDEYVGISKEHPASFRRWLRTRFADKVRPAVTHYLDGDAADINATLGEYARMLTAAPVDLAFVGIGENGHIAFNDPPFANFEDSLIVKRVALDEACRQQQVGEGHFPDRKDVPQEAITVTCSGLFRAEKWICCVTDSRKATAVKNSLEGPVTTACPGSLVHRHPSAALFLDMASAALLSPEFVRTRCRVHRASELNALPAR